MICYLYFQVIKSQRFTDPESVDEELDRKDIDVAGKFLPYQPPEGPVTDDNINKEDVEKLEVSLKIPIKVNFTGK